MDLPSWLARYFRAQTNFRSGESNFNCPKCGHSSFYFSIFKRIGYCHRDKCHWKPDLSDLIEIVGVAPEDALESSIQNFEYPTPSEEEISLPEGSQKLVERKAGRLVSRFPEAYERVAERGVKPESQHRFNLHIGNGRIYIPVYFQSKIVSYVGRACWWINSNLKRYEYPKGAKVTNYLFNWDEFNSYKEITLVENTFNSIWLSDNGVPTTSTFGSNLSDLQGELIARSSIEKVNILWDEGAEKSAWKASKKLRKLGVSAFPFSISGQPDDHSLHYLNSVLQGDTKC